ncbi:Glutamate synthase large subunit-like protein, partial [Geodia barretti]
KQHLFAGGDRRHPHQGGARPLPDARLLALQEHPDLRRSDLPAGHAHALRHRGLPREVHNHDGDRARGQAPAGARHPGLYHRHELRRALYEAKTALARGATMAGTATCSGEGGMIPDERRYSEKWLYQCIQSRYGFNPHHLRLADACEFFIGQGCKVGLGGHLMGQKVTDQVAEMRSLPAGIDQRSPARHPDWLGPDDLSLKINEIREATNSEIPIQLKLGAARVYDDVRMAIKTGPDSIYIDGMEGSTGAGPHLATEETGVPGIAAIRQARKALDDLGATGSISLVYAGGVRNGGDIAKALALGADAVAIGHSVMMALNCNKDIPEADYETEIGVEAGYCYHCHTGRCPVGVATQDPELRKRLDPDEAAERVYNFLHTLTLECQMMARACGKTDVHSLEPEDLAALTMEASAMAQVPLAGSQHTVGRPDMNRY